ncbi:transposable element Tcb1 transposase [Trichonephila clavata]|uniref:Transposable element Tcb1 transposase n=1 Tax=Trichonephila clavata TaxID=2740835 RepID=A0A8X6G8C6_TRICU|nr:transposable element Tcb1 transposase [Trichonephila clavata]
MSDLSEFPKGMVVGARLSGSSVTEAAHILGFPRSTISAVMKAYSKEGKTTSSKHKSGRKSKLADRGKKGLEAQSSP